MTPAKRNQTVTWTCGECLATTQSQPQYDGDIPLGWFRLEDDGSIYIMCSLKCLAHFVAEAERTKPPSPEERAPR